MKIRVVLAAAAVLCAGLTARADSFTYTITGTASGTAGTYSGTGTFSGSPSGTAGAYRIDSISGSGTTGIIDPGVFEGNDNLLTPGSTPFVDGNGISFYQQGAQGVYAVNLHSVGSDYFVDVTEVNTSEPYSTTLPITFNGSSPTAQRSRVRFALFAVAPPQTSQPGAAVAATPEPGSLALLGSGMIALVAMGRRRFGRS